MPCTLGEVLFEQLEDLVRHEVRCARPLCPDCGRFKRAARVLLEPFNEPDRPAKPLADAVAQAARVNAALQRWYERTGRSPLP